MKICIPEIGTQLQLLKDWTFELHAEDRNEGLLEIFGHMLACGKALDKSLIEYMPMMDYQAVEMPAYATSAEYDRIMKASPVYQQHTRDYQDWRARAEPLFKDKITVTLPAGTILKIDRIYIRKGASDYSSISFYAYDLGTSVLPEYFHRKSRKVKTQRFWAKLEDCNNIECHW